MDHHLIPRLSSWRCRFRRYPLHAESPRSHSERQREPSTTPGVRWSPSSLSLGRLVWALMAQLLQKLWGVNMVHFLCRPASSLSAHLAADHSPALFLAPINIVEEHRVPGTRLWSVLPWERFLELELLSQKVYLLMDFNANQEI